MKLLLYGRYTARTDVQAICQFLVFARQQGIDVLVLQDYADALGAHDGFARHQHLLTRTCATMAEAMPVDYVYCVGGDGTMLDAVRFVGRTQVPVLGINAGRLGFLAGANQDELETATRLLLDNAWQEDRRTMIEVESGDEKLFGEDNFGMNEVTIHKANSNEMITIHAYLNGEFLNSYWADGLIISTPTGSTAYNLACGGPIIEPHSRIFVMTPIAPHSLTVRPVVIEDDSVVSFEIESRSGKVMVAIDNRSVLVNNRVEFAIRKSATPARLIKFSKGTYFSTLRTRLNWGLDARN